MNGRLCMSTHRLLLMCCDALWVPVVLFPVLSVVNHCINVNNVVDMFLA